MYGDNMRGKTSLMNAIRYAFFGEVHGRGGADPRYLVRVQPRPCRFAGKYGFTVGLSLRYDGADFDLMRVVTRQRSLFRRVTKTSQPRFPYAAAASYLGPPIGRRCYVRCYQRMSPDFFCLTASSSISTPNCSSAQSDAGRLISEAIEHILGVPVLRDARDHLTVARFRR